MKYKVITCNKNTNRQKKIAPLNFILHKILACNLRLLKFKLT